MKKNIITLLFAIVALTMSAQKSVSILGDSYSTYEGYVEPMNNFIWYKAVCDTTKTDVNDVTQTWWHQFIKNNGYKLEKNNSFSGSTICNTGYHGNDYSDRSFIARMDNLGCPDLIFIFGATNDSWAGVPLGEMQYEGWSKDDLYMFRPALCYMLHHMTRRYINTDIVFLINDGLNPEVTSSIREACDHYDIRYIDLEAIGKKAGHPDQTGMTQIANQISGFLGADR